MEKQDIIELIKSELKDNLTISIDSNPVPYGNGKDIEVNVELIYNEETIAESSVTITEGE